MVCKNSIQALKTRPTLDTNKTVANFLWGSYTLLLSRFVEFGIHCNCTFKMSMLLFFNKMVAVYICPMLFDGIIV